jgi:hypothetical protein
MIGIRMRSAIGAGADRAEIMAGEIGAERRRAKGRALPRRPEVDSVCHGS